MTELPSDAHLIAAVRQGDTDAYGQLYERHVAAAKRAASCLVKDAAAREDLVADAFARVLSALRAGNGPLRDFRPYLLVTLRNAAISISRKTHESLYAEVPDHAAEGDPVLDRWHASAASDAFASLPERWRMVLWHTEIEGESPATIAGRLGLSPNSVAALAYRAREGLRQAYLRAHLSAVEESDCRATVAKLAGWVRNSGPLGRRTTRHLASCSECRGRADTLASVNDELRMSVLPVLLLVGSLPAQTGIKAVIAKFAAAVVVAATAATTVSSSTPTVLAEAAVPVLPVPATGEAASVVTGPVTVIRVIPPPSPPSPPPPVTAEAPARLADPREEAAEAPAPPTTVPPANGNGNGNAFGNGNGNAYGKNKEKKQKNKNR